MTLRIRTAAALSLLLIAVQSAKADLKEYLAKPEPNYKWEKVGEQDFAGGRMTDIQMVSQTWQGMDWKHRLQIFRPSKNEFPNFCVLLNTGGNGSPANTAMASLLANKMGCTFAILFGIPNQPLYGGKTEDALVVYTWMKFMETGDESWPLHFPMAKACLKAIDTIQAVAAKDGWKAPGEYMVTGASKRGWTTWLTGASGDKRIKAIAPMVIDVLNVAAQTQYQKESYGAFSEQIGDYTAVDIPSALKTPKGKRLLELEDPYSYRDILTLPKLIILGTNDRYWTQDALNLYWDGLKGEKWVTYTPNSGHGLEDRDHVFATMTAFARRIASKSKWPKMDWSYAEIPGGSTTLSLKSSMPVKSFRLYSCSSATKDFRDSKWTYETGTGADKAWSASTAPLEDRYLAVFGEAVYELEPGREFTLSTQIRIIPPKNKK